MYIDAIAEHISDRYHNLSIDKINNTIMVTTVLDNKFIRLDIMRHPPDIAAQFNELLNLSKSLTMTVDDAKITIRGKYIDLMEYDSLSKLDKALDEWLHG